MQENQRMAAYYYKAGTSNLKRMLRRGGGGGGGGSRGGGSRGSRGGSHFGGSRSGGYSRGSSTPNRKTYAYSTKTTVTRKSTTVAFRNYGYTYGLILYPRVYYNYYWNPQYRETYQPLCEYYLPKDYVNPNGSYYSTQYSKEYTDGYGYDFYYGGYGYYDYSM